MISLLVCGCGTKSETGPVGKTTQKVSEPTPETGSEDKVHKSGLTRCLESAAQLAADRQSIGEIFCREARRLDVTGAALIFAESEHATSHIYYGRRCSNGRERVDADTHFTIASLTKAATALVVLDLLDKNRRPLSDSMDDQPGSPPVLDLLQHTAGARVPGPAHGAQRTQDEEADPSTGIAPWFDAGELWHYDNANYRVLGEQLRKADWKFDEAWSARFAPSGPRLQARPNGACDHTWVDGNPVPIPPPQQVADAAKLAGGARATATEMLDLLEAIAGEPRVLASATPTGEGDRYGLGLRVHTAAGGTRTTWAHTGAGVGSWAWMRGDETGARAAILTNRNVALSETVAALDAQVFEVDAVIPPTRPAPSRLVGDYRVRDWDQAVTVRQADARLLLDIPALGTSGVELQPEGRWGYRAHLPMQAGSQTLLFVESKGQIWLRSPWFVARKNDPS